ncbi:MAG: M20/M25/M40 family metallo-hydrolase [Chloroflexi bacterium]|nr:M20/M25/M40 family metallo-hydrolase [Chloroflexota bacterium]
MQLAAIEQQVLDRIHGADVANLALELGHRRSPDGCEWEVGQFILVWFEKQGFRTIRQEVAFRRYNAIGILPGKGGGRSLLYNGHMDTEYQFGDDDWWLHRNTDRIYYQCWIDGDRIFGRDIVNDKGPMACFMVVGKAIKEAGLQLPGDLILTCVIGEMGFTPVDEFVGPKYLGCGAGAAYLAKHGPRADFAIVAEDSDYIPSPVQTGDARFKFTVPGEKNLTTSLQHPDRFEEDPSAIVKMSVLVQALSRWAKDFGNRHFMEYNVAGYSGISRGKVGISAIRGGLPYWNLTGCGVCGLYIHVYYPPNITGDQVKKELQDLVRGIGFGVDVEMYSDAPGAASSGVEPVLGAIDRAHAKIFRDKLPSKRAPEWLSSMRRDCPDFVMAGMPSVTYGPKAPLYHGSEMGESPEFFTFADLETMTRLYALIAMDICGQAKK